MGASHAPSCGSPPRAPRSHRRRRRVARVPRRAAAADRIGRPRDPEGGRQLRSTPRGERAGGWRPQRGGGCGRCRRGGRGAGHARDGGRHDRRGRRHRHPARERHRRCGLLHHSSQAQPGETADAAQDCRRPRTASDRAPPTVPQEIQRSAQHVREGVAPYSRFIRAEKESLEETSTTLAGSRPTSRGCGQRIGESAA